MGKAYEICFYGGLVLAVLFLIATIVLFIVLKIPKVLGELTGRTARKEIADRKKGNADDNSIAKREQAKYYNQGTGKITARDAVSEKTRKQNRDDTTDLLRTDAPGMKYMDTDETEVLGAGRHANEDVTEVLGAGRLSDNGATEVLGTGNFSGDDNATDVLTSDEFEGDNATDVLTSDEFDGDNATDVLTSDEFDGDNATDVLTTDERNVNSAVDTLEFGDAKDNDATSILSMDDDIEESTTVLRKEITDELSRKVKVLYNIVVTHTDETL